MSTHARSLDRVSKYVCRQGMFPCPQLVAPLHFEASLKSQKLPLPEGEELERVRWLSGVLAAQSEIVLPLSPEAKSKLLRACSDSTWWWDKEGTPCDYVESPDPWVVEDELLDDSRDENASDGSG